MSRMEIEQMNQELARLMEDGDDITTAVEIVAQRAGLTLVEDDHEVCRIYRTDDGELIKVWFEGIEVGFDDQVEWYTNQVVCKNCGQRFDISTDPDWMEADDGGDICGQCVREAEANIMQPEYPDDSAIS